MTSTQPLSPRRSMGRDPSAPADSVGDVPGEAGFGSGVRILLGTEARRTWLSRPPGGAAFCVPGTKTSPVLAREYQTAAEPCRCSADS